MNANATRLTITVVLGLAVFVAAAAPATAAVPGGDAGTTVSSPTDGAGQPADLPGPVPGFVEEILGAIGEFLSGLTPGDPATDRPAVAEGG